MTWKHWFRELSAGSLGADPDLSGFAPIRQLKYVFDYVRRLGGHSYAVEPDYIDRDFIEDFSVFYSKCFEQIPNRCLRIHFFGSSVEQVTDWVTATHHRKTVPGRQSVRSDAGPAPGEASVDVDDGSGRSETGMRPDYLGFCVLRPLANSPVGRTVLKHYPSAGDDGGSESLRIYSGKVSSVVHFLGIQWTVSGLPFQQQDTGVAACATTAIWSSLHAIRDRERSVSATPVTITQFATRYSIPGGRPMPGGELDIDQMCQAVRGCGLSPVVFRLEDNLALARFLFESSLASGDCPIVMCRNESGEGHAMTLTGLKYRPHPSGDGRSDIFEQAFLHDDRVGPNLTYTANSATSQSVEAPTDDTDVVTPPMSLQLDGTGHPDTSRERWRVTHMLVPTHPKIRLTLADLRAIAASVRQYFDGARKTLNEYANRPQTTSTRVGCRFVRGPALHKELLTGSDRFDQPCGALSAENFSRFVSTLPLPRYVGRIDVRNDAQHLCVLVDSTAARIHAKHLAILSLRSDEIGSEVAGILSEALNCEAVFSESP